MLNEDFTLEKEFYLDMDEENELQIINTFQLADTTQLPVVEQNKLIGILDLFTYVKALNQKEKMIVFLNTIAYNRRFYQSLIIGNYI
ncbi:hypothetical protein [Wukongibacter baidiensis]